MGPSRWILNNPHVDNLIITMRNRDEVEEYVAASGSGEVTATDREDARRTLLQALVAGPQVQGGSLATPPVSRWSSTPPDSRRSCPR